MNPTDHKRFVVVALALVAAAGAAHQLAHPTPTSRLPAIRWLVGVAFAAIVLTALAEVEPETAAALAATMLVGVILAYGADVFGVIANLTKPGGIK